MSLRKSINAMCRSCIYDPSNGGTCAQQIRDCTVRACPLWLVRPGAAKPAPTPEQVLRGQKLALARQKGQMTAGNDVSGDS